MEQILAVRCVQSWFAHVVTFVGLDPSADGLEQMEALLQKADWSSAVQTWKEFYQYYRPERAAQLDEDGVHVTFRGSAVRDGKHDYQSPDVAEMIGAAVVDYLPFHVQLSNYDMEVSLLSLYIFSFQL